MSHLSLYRHRVLVRELGVEVTEVFEALQPPIAVEDWIDLQYYLAEHRPEEQRSWLQ